ncbi:MAG: fimbrial protein [Candidatus Cryptobacteroides sp.]
MRKFYLPVLAAMVSFASCTKMAEVEQPEINDDVVDIVFKIPTEETKTTGGVNDTGITSVQVFVFKKDGTIDNSLYQSNATTVTLKCTSGPKDVVALVNGPKFQNVTSFSELKSRTTALANNSTSSLIMVGITEANIQTGTTVTVPVKRAAAMILVKQVSVNFTQDYYNTLPFKLKKIMISNVPGDVSLDGTSTPTFWHNKMGVADSNDNSVISLIKDDINAYNLTSSTPYTTEHKFLCYPNSTSSDANGGTWSARKTRIVICTTLNGKDYYYPITLNKVESNKKYSLSLLITKPGSEDPDTPITTLDANVMVDIVNWETGATLSETI